MVCELYFNEVTTRKKKKKKNQSKNEKPGVSQKGVVAVESEQAGGLRQFYARCAVAAGCLGCQCSGFAAT